MLFSIRAMKGIVQNDFNNKTNLQKNSKAHVVSKYTKIISWSHRGLSSNENKEKHS